MKEMYWVVLLTGNCMKTSWLLNEAQTLSLLFKIVKPDIQSKDYSNHQLLTSSTVSNMKSNMHIFFNGNCEGNLNLAEP